MIVPSDYILKAVMRNFRQTSHCMVPHYICAIVRGRIKGAGVSVYTIWHCPLGLPSANMRINEMGIPSANISLSVWEFKGAGVSVYAIWHCPLGLPSANMRINEIGIPSANISLTVLEFKGTGVPLFSYWHWEALAGSANISLIDKILWSISKNSFFPTSLLESNNSQIQKERHTKVSVHTVSLRISM